MKNHVVYVIKGFALIKIVKITKIRDHCHFTGKYRGVVNSMCNLKYKVPKNIAVIFHNGSIYDNHLIIRQISKDLMVILSVLVKILKNILLFL